MIKRVTRLIKNSDDAKEALIKLNDIKVIAFGWRRLSPNDDLLITLQRKPKDKK